MNHKGFTTQELSIVLASIIFLCVAVVPLFGKIQTSNRVREMNQIITVVQKGLDIGTSYPVLDSVPMVNHFPAMLDDQPSQRRCLTCFNAVLKKGVNNVLWFKVSDREYLFSTNKNFGEIKHYQEPGDYKVTYLPETGKIKSETIR